MPPILGRDYTAANVCIARWRESVAAVGRVGAGSLAHRHSAAFILRAEWRVFFANNCHDHRSSGTAIITAAAAMLDLPVEAISRARCTARSI